LSLSKFVNNFQNVDIVFVLLLLITSQLIHNLTFLYHQNNKKVFFFPREIFFHFCRISPSPHVCMNGIINLIELNLVIGLVIRKCSLFQILKIIIGTTCELFAYIFSWSLKMG
jgi:hypothetical protein